MALNAGERLGPYQILGLIGSGGMGEVYRARDPRLERDVAVKVLPAEVASSPDRLTRFELEARAVAALNHPNILTVFDVGTEQPAVPVADAFSAAEPAAIPYLVTELLQGETLRELMRHRMPTQQQVLSLAAQIASGLDAAHAHGLVHRDVKPDNVFVTSDGRVKILDFGIAKLSEPARSKADSSPTGPGVAVGTVGYMSPEQLRGLPLDQRTDIFSLGVVMYELLSGGHPFRRDSAAATVAAILEETPPDLSTLTQGVPRAVSGLVARCLEKDREQRFRSAHDLGLSLEAALSAPAGAASLQQVEEKSPYPGLSSFTEKDASCFFGREAEVEALWQRLRTRALVGVIGPSGAGKTSFVRAGVVASRPDGWGCLVCSTGRSAFRGLGRALVPELSGDPQAVGALVDVDDPEVAFDLVGRWRRRHGEALLVVDQFEELFTLNAQETQQRFAQFLGRLVAEADVHVLLSLRDDFLMKCAEHEGLSPVFEALCPLPPLSADGVRCALLEPARRRGFEFEDETLVGEMAAATEGARAALPLLAFAVSRLWEKRDRERKLLTRAAYEEIGGVAGALAQHAEATMDHIGADRQAIVRELFRCLVTAQGTREVMDRGELLSAFPDRAAAEEVLGLLLDGRLLTSYEVEGALGRSHHRLEIVHESLLTTWPRLVRWRAQDEEGALLRDQLKQAAHLWEEKGRTSDLLWTGTAYREFELWRERYPGALTALEEDFARALADKARRRRRIIRATVAAVFLVSTGVSIAIAVSRQQAVVAAQRAEATKLLAVAQVKLQEDPTEALAYTTASLELADTKEARLMALRALQEAPPAWELQSEIKVTSVPEFSPDGHHLAMAGFTAEVGVWADDGSPPLRLPGHETSPSGGNRARWASDELLVTGEQGRSKQVHVWSVPGGEKLRTIDFGRPSRWQVGPGRLFAQTPEGAPIESFVGGGLLQSWRLPDGEPEVLGHVDARKLGITSSFFEPHGRAWLYTKGTTIHTVPLPVDLGADRVFSRHGANVELAEFLGPDLLSLHDASGENRLLRFPENGPPVTTVVPKPGSAPAEVSSTSSVRYLRGDPSAEAKLRLWDTAALPGARPLELRRAGAWALPGVALDPAGRIAVVSTHSMSRLTFWPLPARWPSVVDGYKKYPLFAFSPDSRWLATAALGDRQVRLWPLPGTGSSEVRTLGVPPDLPPMGIWWELPFDPRGRYLIVSTFRGDNAWILPLDGSPPRRLSEDSSDTVLSPFAVSPTGRHVARAVYYGKGPKTLRVWDVESGVPHLFDSPVTHPLPGSTPQLPTGYEGIISNLAFLDDSTLYTAGDGGIRRWDLETGAHVLVKDSGPGAATTMTMTDDRRVAFTQPWSLEPQCAPLERLDLAAGVSTPLPRFGDCPELPQVAGPLLASASADGILVVPASRVTEREAHLFPGKFVTVTLAISPDLKWVASASDDKTLRLWPMPDLDQPPLHTLPHDELVAKLRSLTNLRAVREAKSVTGWSIELGPFPGWKDFPTW